MAAQKRAAFSLPGKLTTYWKPFMPAAPREKTALGVSSRERRRRYSAMPGMARSQKAAVASGVLSRGAGPVPPVVRIQSAPGWRPRAASTDSSPSGTISVSIAASGCADLRTSTMAGPERSA